MKPFVIALLLLSTPWARGADAATGVTFYIQLIRGSDADAPPTPQARLIGPRLDRKLHGVFKWKNYWEIQRDAVTLKSGDKVRRRMTPQREIELDWAGSREMTVSIYADGKMTRKREQSVDTAFYIAGGDRDPAQCWFIVVRRDNPDADQGAASKFATQ